MQINWENLTNADWKLTNSNSSKPWAIVIGNASLSTLDDSDKTINGSSLYLNQSGSFDYVGMTKEQWEILKKTNPDYLELTIPKPSAGCTALWKCDDSLTTCVDLTTETGVTLINTTDTTQVVNESSHFHSAVQPALGLGMVSSR